LSLLSKLPEGLHPLNIIQRLKQQARRVVGSPLFEMRVAPLGLFSYITHRFRSGINNVIHAALELHGRMKR
jgi:hypothetical protein